MKKIALFLVMLIVSVLELGTFSACRDTEKPSGTEMPAEKTYVVEFNVQGNGNVYNDRRQIVKEGENTQIVVAMADLGYYFAGWSDDASENTDQTKTWDQRIIENVRQNMSFCAIFKRIIFQVSYVADENGKIEGTLVQSVPYGESTESVTAVANTGYRFVNWSDGLESATRNEVDLLENKELTANFEIISNVYKYNYKFADGNCSEENISLTYGLLSDVKLLVPTREYSTFDGWYSDHYLTQQVADENGNILVGDEFFYTDCTRLNAKWISENTHPYKILIVYVTELNAEVTSRYRDHKVQVNYQMTDLERQICHMLTERISFELNDLAVADFQVDEYFTTTPVTTENINEVSDNTNETDLELFAYNIPEVQGMLDKYDSVLTSFSMDDYFGDLGYTTGLAQGKYCSIRFDDRLSTLVHYKEPFENLLDPLYEFWPNTIETYWHELAHTVEQRIVEFYEFHKVCTQYGNDWAEIPREDWDELRHMKLYFLNKAEVDSVGGKVGVWHEFWEGKYSELYYESTEGGTAYEREQNGYYVHRHNGSTQYIMHGNDGRMVTAYPNTGYEFIGWSDGVMDATRQDFNITEDLHVYALFAPVKK